MSFPTFDATHYMRNRLLLDELIYDRAALAEEHAKLMPIMTYEQHNVYTKIMRSVVSDLGRVFLIYGYGEIGKTFMWRALSAAIKSKGEIVLNIASSGITSLLSPGGRTALSRFAIPLNPTCDSTCDINQKSHFAELTICAKLIIWDEEPMMNKHCFEVVDNTLKSLLSVNNPSMKKMPFGGKPVVFGGDFRQILPVVPKGSRQDIVNALKYDDLSTFSKWIADIGDGKLGGHNDGCVNIDIPDDFLLHYSSDPLQTIVDSTYLMFRDAPSDPHCLKDRAILAPTLNVVESAND